MARDARKPPRGPAADGPGPRLVVSNNEQQIASAEKREAQERAARRLRSALRSHAANLIRVVRGAGKPHEVGKECSAIIEALHGYHEACGYWPLPEIISQALDIDRPVDWGKYPAEGLRLEAHEAIVRGSLQVAASRLAGQRTQELS